MEGIYFKLWDTKAVSKENIILAKKMVDQPTEQAEQQREYYSRI
jgi:hypothetical protein